MGFAPVRFRVMMFEIFLLFIALVLLVVWAKGFYSGVSVRRTTAGFTARGKKPLFREVIALHVRRSPLAIKPVAPIFYLLFILFFLCM